MQNACIVSFYLKEIWGRQKVFELKTTTFEIACTDHNFDIYHVDATIWKKGSWLYENLSPTPSCNYYGAVC